MAVREGDAGEPGRGQAAALVGGLAYLSAILCTVGLGKASLWIDEAHSWEFSSLPSAWLVVLNAAARDAYPPLYFLLLHFWMKLGSDEVWLRMFSVLFHVACVPLIYLVAARMVSRRVGIIAAALLSLSPFHLTFAREVRMYPLVAFLSLLSVWGLLVWLQDRSRTGWRVMTAANLALLYTHFMGALLLAAEAVVFLARWRDRETRRGSCRWLLWMVIGFLPWSPFFLKALLVTGGYGAEAPALSLLSWFLGAAGAGFGHATWLVLLSCAALLVLASIGFNSMRPGVPRTMLAAWAVVPPLLELLAGALGKPVWSERTLITAVPAWLILAGAAVAALPPRRSAAAALLLGWLAGTGCAHLLSRVKATAPAGREALRYVLERARPGDIILHSSTVTYHPLHEYYLRRAGKTPRDYLVEPAGSRPMPGGGAGRAFRDAWRKVRSVADPRGVLRTGTDPDRRSAEGLARMRFERVWYFRTTPAGLRRLWLQSPARFYGNDPATFRECPLADYPPLERELRKTGEYALPGLAVELWERR